MKKLICPHCTFSEYDIIVDFNENESEFNLFSFKCSNCNFVLHYTKRNHPKEKINQKELNFHKNSVLNFIYTLKGLSPKCLNKMDEGRNILTEWDSSYKIIEEIFMKGNCGAFYFLLKHINSQAIPYGVYVNDSDEPSHIITKISNNFYDIRGIFDARLGLKLDDDKITKIEMISEEEIKENNMNINYSFVIRGPII